MWIRQLALFLIDFPIILEEIIFILKCFLSSDGEYHANLLKLLTLTAVEMQLLICPPDVMFSLEFFKAESMKVKCAAFNLELCEGNQHISSFLQLSGERGFAGKQSSFSPPSWWSPRGDVHKSNSRPVGKVSSCRTCEVSGFAVEDVHFLCRIKSFNTLEYF